MGARGGKAKSLHWAEPESQDLFFLPQCAGGVLAVCWRCVCLDLLWICFRFALDLLGFSVELLGFVWICFRIALICFRFALELLGLAWIRLNLLGCALELLGFALDFLVRCALDLLGFVWISLDCDLELR